MPRLMLLFHSKGRHEYHRVHCQPHPSISDPSTSPVVRNYSYKMLEPPSSLHRETSKTNTRFLLASRVRRNSKVAKLKCSEISAARRGAHSPTDSTWRCPDSRSAGQYGRDEVSVKCGIMYEEVEIECRDKHKKQ